MATMKYKCPSCGYTVSMTVGKAKTFGSPIRRCPSCGKQYYDERYHEIALEKIKEDEIPFLTNRAKKLILIVVITLIGVGLYSYDLGWKFLLQMLGIILAVYLIPIFIMLWLCARNRKRLLDIYSREKKLSEERCKNKEYVDLIYSLRRF